MSQLADIIPLKKLEKSLQIKLPNLGDALESAKAMFKEAKYYLATSSHQVSSSLKIKLQKIFDVLITCLESIITAFGVADFFKSPENDMQANTKAQRIFMLVSLFGVLTAALLPLLGAVVTTPIVGGVILCLAALSIIYPHIKPMPHKINKTVNWTRLIEEGKLIPSQANKKYLDAIAEAIITGKNVKSNPMLFGQTGVGKTETVKAFVKAVKEGIYPELEGMQFFYINCADLVNGPGKLEGGSKELHKISEAMGRHRDKIVLIFDEIHVLCQARSSVLADQLKILLDDAHEGFPFVMGITTQHEFYRDIYRYNPAFARRFQKINIDNLEDQEVEQILGGVLLQTASDLLVDHEALEFLINKTNDAFPQAVQPAASIRILSQCIKRLSETQKSDLEEKINKKRTKLEFLLSKNIMSPGANFLPYNKQNFDKIVRKEKELLELEENLKTFKKLMEAFFQKRQYLGKLKQELYEDVVSISKFQKNLTMDQKKRLKSFMIKSHILAPSIDAMLRQQADLLNVKTTINHDLVEEVIASEMENQNSIDKAIESGKEDLEARENGGIISPVLP